MASPVRSQNGYLLKISGKVIDKKSGDRIEGVRLTLFKNDKQDGVIITKKKGKFSFDLDLNSTYILQATEQSHITTKYVFNTNVPPDAGPEVGVFWNFTCEIQLIASFKGIKSEEPISNVGYDQKNNIFWYDKEYTAGRKSEIESSVDEMRKKAAEEEAKKAEDDSLKEAERLAKEAKAVKKAEEEKLTEEADAEKAERKRLAREAEATKAEEEQMAKEAAEEEKRLAKEAVAKKAGEKRLAAEEAARKKAARKEAQRKAEEEKMAREAAKTKAYLIFLAETARTEEEQAIKRAKTVEALLQRKRDESKANEEKEKLEKEKEIIKIDQITDDLTKAKAKRLFLEEIADSKRAMKQKITLQINE